MMENSMPKLIKAEHNEMNYLMGEGDVLAVGTIYTDNSPCITLNDPTSERVMVKATSNISHIALHHTLHDVVAIKDYSENEGVLNTLVNAEIVSLIYNWQPISSGHTKLQLVRLVDKDILKDIEEALEYVNYLDNQRCG